MSGINRQPTGILGFLGIKNFGRNPEQVGEVLSPVWDYAPWYLQTNAQFRNAAVSFNAVGFFAVFQVPNNEVWTVHALSCLAGPLGGGETIRIHAAIADQASSVFTILPTTSDDRVATANDFGICAAQGNFILGPGEVAGMFCSDLTTVGAIGATAAIRLTAMQA